MKIAITGGTGFLGEYVVERLVNENYKPVILSRDYSYKITNGYEYRFTDYSKADLIEKLIDIDAIIHLASKRGSQEIIAEFHSNELLTQNLYDACLYLNITNIVFASSISVYSNKTLLPWKESQIPAPNLMYGVSKVTNEYIGNIYSEKHEMNIKNLRLTHLYGFNEKNNYMVNLFFRLAFNKRRLELNTKSVAKREFLFVKDAAKAIVLALKHMSVSGTFNIGSGEVLTNYEVADKINKAFGNYNNLLVKAPNAHESIESSYFDSNKAEKTFGFLPDYTFPTALDEIYIMMRSLEDVPLWY